MHTVKIQASITKQTITRHDLHMLCLALIKQVMSIPLTKETLYVPQVSQQGQNQSATDSGVEALKCSNFLTQQEALV
jgi:hypothetical protein